MHSVHARQVMVRYGNEFTVPLPRDAPDRKVDLSTEHCKRNLLYSQANAF